MYKNNQFRNSLRIILILYVLWIMENGNISFAQAQDNWNDKKCAVVLTYDDALNVHLDNVIPLLDSLGLKATFYLSGFFQSFRERAGEWVTVAKHGHELGNHTLFHPCEGKAKGREWVKSDYDLNVYTPQRIKDEIIMANTLLEVIDGKKKRTFAYPCGDMIAGNSSYVDKIKELFIGARGVEGKIVKMNEVDIYNIPSFKISGQSGSELIGLVKKTLQDNCLLVFLFHGVGGEHSLNVTLDAHKALLTFLKQNEGDIWVAPLAEIAEYIKINRR
jgi:peptidoglycan-N-acetylglucosamine deacetylase